MTKKEFENEINWDEYGIGYTSIYIPLFNKEIEFELFSKDSSQPIVSDKMYETVKDVLSLPLEVLDKIKKLLWEECHFTFTVADYGCEPKEGETVSEAHFREFELSNAEDAYRKCNIKGIQIHYESDELEGRYAEIKIDTATDNLISVIVKNGKVIDYDDDGTFLGWFETDEQHAHNSRRKVLYE